VDLIWPDPQKETIMPKSTGSAKLDHLLNELAAPHRRAREIVQKELHQHNYKHSSVDHVEWETAMTLQFLGLGMDIELAKDNLMRVGAMLNFLPAGVTSLPAIRVAWRAYMNATMAEQAALITFHLEQIGPALNQARQELYGQGAVMVHAIFLLETVLHQLPPQSDGSSEETDGINGNLEAILEAMTAGTLQLDETWQQIYPRAKDSLEHCAQAIIVVREYLGTNIEDAALILLKGHLQAALTLLKPRLQ
jgi:hypothetical protein